MESKSGRYPKTMTREEMRKSSIEERVKRGRSVKSRRPTGQLAVQFERTLAVDQLRQMAKGLDVEAAAIIDQAKTNIEKLIKLEAGK